MSSSVAAPRSAGRSAVFLIVAGIAIVQAQQLPPGAEALLKEADVGAILPPSFRANMALRVGEKQDPHQIEIWRAGDERMLIRFLEKSERGRYLVRLSSELWLLTKGAKKPVRVSNSHRLYGGATIDAILGAKLTERYKINAVNESGSGKDAVVEFELRAIAADEAYPHVRYTVRRATARPLRAVYGTAAAKPLVSVDFVEWAQGRAVYPRRLTVTDMVRKGAVTDVTITQLEIRDVPAKLFDLSDHSARNALEAGRPK